MPSVNSEISALEWSDATTFVSDLAAPVVALTAAVIAALVIAAVLRRLLRVSARRWSLLGSLSDRVKWPLRLLFVSIAVWLTLAITTELPSDGILEHTAYIVVIVSTTFLAIEVARAVQDGIRSRYSIDDEDNRYARRVHTQVQILGRLTIALIVVIAIAAVLLSFPQMRALGASILASAGLAAIVAGIAAQSALGNVFAGLQIALADAIRVDDVVVVEEEYGRIEEITLTYVVVRVWDDRRMILPSTYFTTSPYENWTRTASDLVGTVELDVDWTVPVEGMRHELDRLLSETDLWDGRKAGIQVTDATGGLVQVRALASATSAPILWDLRCYLREGLVAWIQESGAGLPRTRLERAPGSETATASGILPS